MVGFLNFVLGSIYKKIQRKRISRTLRKFSNILLEGDEENIRVIVSYGEVIGRIWSFGTCMDFDSGISLLIVTESNSFDKIKKKVESKFENFENDFDFEITPLVLKLEEFKEDFKDKERFRKKVKKGIKLKGENLIENMS